MKRTHISFFIFVLFLVCSAAVFARGDSDDPAVLNVYCYDSFSSEWGPGPVVAEAFTEATGIEVVYHAPGDAVTVLNQLILEEGRSPADVIIGLDNSLLERALESGILSAYKSPALDRVDPALIFDPGYRLLPYDYGHFAINYDSAVLPEPPTSLEDLTDPEYAESLVLMDPRTSTPGLGFLLWTVAVYGEDWPEYWERLKPSILTITDGWSQGYALFTSGEAPLVLSYGTSPAYHAEYEETDRFRAAEFSDGHVVQIEGVGILKSSAQRDAAEAFVDIMLSPLAQKAFAMTNVMLPVTDDVSLPESFNLAIHPARVLNTDGASLNSAETEEIIARWTEVFSR